MLALNTTPVGANFRTSLAQRRECQPLKTDAVPHKHAAKPAFGGIFNFKADKLDLNKSVKVDQLEDTLKDMFGNSKVKGKLTMNDKVYQLNVPDNADELVTEQLTKKGFQKKKNWWE